jgi:hypothetical protein
MQAGEKAAKKHKRKKKAYGFIGAVYVADVVLCAGVPILSAIFAAGGAAAAALSYNEGEKASEARNRAANAAQQLSQQSEAARDAHYQLQSCLRGAISGLLQAVTQVLSFLPYLPNCIDALHVP